MQLSHKFVLICAVLPVVVSLSQNVQAEEKQEDNPWKGWTLSSGIVHNKSTRTTDALSSSRSDTVVVSGVKRHDDKTFYGGSFAYTNGSAKTVSDSGNTDTQVVSGSLFAMRRIDNLIILNASVSHGGVNLDNTHTSGTGIVSFDGDSDFWALGVGATKIIPIKQGITATASANYSLNYTDSGGITDSSGGLTPGNTTTQNKITLGSGVSWRIDDKWTPNAKLNWHYASKSLHNATNDKDYFSYSLGTRYALQSDTNVSAAYSSAFAKTETRDHSLSLTVSWSF